jgi:hypothetical protein
MTNHLPTSFYQIPHCASTTMTRKDLKETLLATDGWVLSCGEIFDIKSKHLGAGVYRISLEERK